MHFSGVKPGSSSYGVISSGGGIYNELWQIMQQKGDWEVKSVDHGMKRVISAKNI